MSSIDERIVQMQFDNKAFEKGVSTSMDSLNKLDHSINNINGSNFSSLSKSVDTIADRFSNLGIVGITVIQNLTNRVVDLGLQMVKSLTVDNIAAGFEKYAQATKDIKALMNSTGEDVDTIDAQLERLSWYSDATSYSYNAMVTALKNFAAQDIGLDKAIPMLMGIGNSLSYAGLAAEEASSAFNLYSKAIGQGYMSNIQWKSLNLMGASTAKLKEQFIAAGLEAKTLKQNLDGSIETVDGLDVSVKEFESTLSAQKGKWLTNEVMEKVFTEYGNYASGLQKMSDEFSKMYGVQLSVNKQMELYDYLAKNSARFNGASFEENIGLDATKEFNSFLTDLTGFNYTLEQTVEIVGDLNSAVDGGIQLNEFGKAAFLAAQEARTFSEAIGAVRDASSSAWRAIFEKIFGNAEEATELWSEFSDWLYDIFVTPLEQIVSIASFWKRIGGRDLLLNAFSEMAKILPAAKKPISDAFGEIFGVFTDTKIVARITVITGKIRDFAINLVQWLTDRSDKIKSIFKGFFALIDIFKTAIGGIIKFAGKLVGAEGGVLDVLISLGAKLGDFIVKVRDFIKTNPKFLEAIEFIKDVLSKPLSIFEKINEQLNKSEEGLSPLEKFKNVLSKIWEFVSKIWEKGKELLGPIKETLGDAFSGEFNFDNLIKLLTILGTIDFAKNLSWVKGEGGGIVGIFKTFFSIIDQARFALESFEESTRAKGIRNMAIAIGILAVSMLILASIEPDKLMRAMVAMAVGLQMLFRGMEKGTSIKKWLGGDRLTGFMTAMIELSVALLIMAAAVKTLASLDIGGLIQGLVGVFAMLKMLTDFSRNLGDNSFKKKGLGSIISLSIGLLILSAAVKVLGSMDLWSLVKGLGSILIFLVAFSSIANKLKKDAKSIKAFGKAMIPMALGLLIFAGAMKIVGGMPLEEIIKGLAGLVGGLVAMGLALKYFNSNGGVAASILVMSIGLVAMAGALRILGTMDMKQVGAALLAVLPVLAAAFLLFKFADWKKALGVSAALVIFSAALLLMVPALAAFASLDAVGIVKALALIAGVMLILGISAYALSGLIAPILGLSIALAIFGVAMITVGMGLTALSAGLAVIGPALTVLVKSILESLPDILTGLTIALTALILALCQAIIKAFPAIIDAINVVLEETLKWLGDELPKLAVWLGEAIIALLVALEIYIPKIVDQLFAIVVSLIDGLAVTIENRGMDLIKAVVHLVKALFMLIFDAFKWFYEDVLKAGFEWVKAFFQGIEESHQKAMEAMGNFILDIIAAAKEKFEAFKDIAKELISGFISGIKEKVSEAIEAVTGFASGVINGVKNFFGINSPSKVMEGIGEFFGEGFIVGLDSTSDKARISATNFSEGILSAIKNPLENLGNLGIDDMNLNPVITPVLDLSEIQNGNEILSKLFQSDNPRFMLNGVTGDSKYDLFQQELLGKLGDPSGGMLGTTYIQNNYSPKSLSQIEIYRQTKNQLSARKA